MSPEEIIFRKYRGKRVLLDSNLLLLFFIGSFERERILVFKRTSQFSLSDFDSLVSLLAMFSTIITTPHILTEVSSLANSLPEHLKGLWCEHFADRTALLLEVFDPALDVMVESAFNPFGLTDAAIQKASANTLILTQDFRLAGYLGAQGIDTLNFRDIVLRS